jgi:hypothetical protein
VTIFFDATAATPGPAVWTRRRTVSRGTITFASVAGFGAGLILVILAYRWASTGNSGFGHYDVFWIGMLLMFAVMAAALLQERVAGSLRTAVLALAGLAGFLPRLLRAPSAPYLNDEIGHWLAARRLDSTGQLFLPNNIVTQTQHYVGLEVLTVGMHRLTGLSVWSSGMTIVAFCHVLSVLGIYALARAVAIGRRPALLAGFLYALSPSFSFFDSMFSYESLAVPLMIWTLVAAVGVANSKEQARTAWCGATLAIGTCCIVTHHLVSFIMLATLAVLAVAQLVLTRKTDPQSWKLVGGLTLVLTAVAAGWAVSRHADVINYLKVYPIDGFNSLRDRLFGGHHATTSSAGGGTIGVQRELFTNARIPAYETRAAFAAQVVIGLAFLSGLYQRRRSITGPLVMVVALALAYFASLPLLLTQGGSSGAHRSWTCSYIGLVLVVACGIEPVLDGRLSEWWSRRRSPFAAAVYGLKARRTTLATLALVVGGAMVLLVGNYGTQNNWLVVFPGKPVYGGDGRVMTKELVTAAQWLDQNGGAGQVVLADRLTRVAFAAYDGSAKAPLELGWQLFFPPTKVSPATEAEVRQTVNYVVVDERMAEVPPASGEYFDGHFEPPVVAPLAQSSLTKFDSLPWMSRVYRSANYSIYEVKP